MLRLLLQHHVLANLTFVLVLAVGLAAYMAMPREQDPSINFNWISILTAVPGASSEEVEEGVTDVLEDALSRVSDIAFVTSTSSENLSTIVVRFNDVDDRVFDKRVSDIRREIQNKEGELPSNADQPIILEITSANAFPTAMVLVSGMARDENLRKQSELVRQDLERFPGVDTVSAIGSADPELQVLFALDQLGGTGVSPTDLADTVTAYFQDLAAGQLELGDHRWLVRVAGTSSDPRYLEALPILTAQGEVPLGSVARVVKGQSDPRILVKHGDTPAVMIMLTKDPKTNTLELVESVKDYIAERNALSTATGVSLTLLDDQTEVIREAVSVMENNALVGLGLVLLTTWIFLGFRMALFTSIGIPFVLAATFAILAMLDQTLNVVVLLGIVMSLGMLVDDAVVVVEAIFYRMERGMEAIDAAVGALREVAAPVASAVFTTIAAFLPLLLLPGLLGDFMRVTPIVVTCALLISLIEAFWMLPVHVVSAEGRHSRSRASRGGFRRKFNRNIRLIVGRALIVAINNRNKMLSMVTLLLVLSLGTLFSGIIKTDFFANDPYRFFYVNVLMPPDTSLASTLASLTEIEDAVRQNLEPGEVRAIASYAGSRLTETEPLAGDNQGQIFVSLLPKTTDLRSVDQIISVLRQKVARIAGPTDVSFLKRSSGPPASKPVSIKVRGVDPDEIRAAADRVISILRGIEGVQDISDDDAPGRTELTLRLRPEAVARAELNPSSLVRLVRLLVDGEVVADMQHQGEKLEVRVRAEPESLRDIQSFLRNTFSLPDGGEIAVGALFDTEIARSQTSIRHYNYRRAITIEADLNKSILDTVEANSLVREAWKEEASSYSNVDLDFSGQLDDIEEGMKALGFLFLFGLGLVYAILSTQFKSYLQPLIVLATVPLAVIGVVFGLVISGHPLSMYTLYGLIALAGIAINDTIVLISNANGKLARGMPPLKAIVSAIRRRVIPIVITTATTAAGLFSLAVGLAGESLIWGPVATVIIWGLLASTILTIFVSPVLYLAVVRPSQSGADQLVDLLAKQVQTDVGLARVRSRLMSKLPIALRNQFGLRYAATPSDRIRFEKGSQLLSNGRYEPAIREFERIAREAPNDFHAQIYAAQALIVYMKVTDWDVGYNARAERYLATARTIAPDSDHLALLAAALTELNRRQESRSGINL